MANANIPRGLVPVRHRTGAPYNGAVNVYYVPSTYATALYPGDPVIHVTAASDANGVPTVQRATAAGGAYISGVMVAVAAHGDPAVPALAHDPRWHVASTAGYILVADDPDLLFEIQEDGVGGAMGVGAAGRNVDLIAGTTTNAMGFSGWMADSSTLQTTNTLQLRILRPVERWVDNDPTLTNAKWLVSINLHSQRNLTGV